MPDAQAAPFDQIGLLRRPLRRDEDAFARDLLRAVGWLPLAVELVASTSRAVLEEVRVRGWDRALERVGVRFVTDTCSYVSPVLAHPDGVTMTDSAKWAFYAPTNIDARVAFGSLRECVLSARAGHVVRLRP